MMNRSRMLVGAASMLVAWCASSGTAFSQTFRDVLQPTSDDFYEMCLGPCACAQLGWHGSMRGSLTVRLISVGDVFDFYAIDDVNFTTTHPNGPVTITGSGTYQVSPIIHQQLINLSLSTNGQPPEQYTSGMVPLRVSLPNLSITAATQIIGCHRTTLTIRAIARCVADTDDGSGFGLPDAGVGIEDLIYYLEVYGRGEGRADVDDGSGTGTPDAGVGVEDLLYFLSRYETGC